MNKFTKRLITSISSSFIGLIIVFNIQDWATWSGELNRTILLTGNIFTFGLVGISLFYLFKANMERKKNQIIISLFTSSISVLVFLMNGLIYSIWFIGK